MTFDSLERYRDYVRYLFAQRGYTVESYKVKFIPISKKQRIEGLIRATDMLLAPQVNFNFEEQIAIDSGDLIRLRYSYQLQTPSHQFRYDKHPKRAQNLVHPLCHLHVSGHHVRYMTHETSIDEILEFILVNFL